MNPTNIEWTHIFGPGTGFTWNPVVGCSFGCQYCYAARQAKRQRQNCQQCYDFTPHLHEERLAQPLRRRKPAGIFLGSMTDLYGPEVPRLWRQRIFAICAQTPQHIYFVLTKQPQNIDTDGLVPPKNVWLGVSCESSAAIVDLVPELTRHDPTGERTLFVSLEPLLGPVGAIETWGRDLDWIIAGAQSGPHAVVPDAGWLKPLMDLTPLFLKDSLRPIFDDECFPQEWPSTRTVSPSETTKSTE
jgi:protein gp37